MEVHYKFSGAAKVLKKIGKNLLIWKKNWHPTKLKMQIRA